MRRSTLLTIGGLAAGMGAARWMLHRRQESLRQRHWSADSRAAARDELAGEGTTSEAGHDGHRRRRRVVVLGSGFAGVAAADRLSTRLRGRRDVSVVLVDRDNFHLFTPMLYQVATGGADPDHIIYATRLIARRHDFSFRSDTVTGFDLQQRIVRTVHGSLPYDYLVVALGSVNNFFGIEGAAEFTLPLKNIADSIAIRTHVLDCFEAAERETDRERRRALLRFVVVGAGATGVELMSSLQDAIANTLLSAYPLVDATEVELHLVEALPEILRGMPRDLVARARRVLEDRGVRVRTNTAVALIDAGKVRTKQGDEIEAETVVWAAGVKATPRVADLPGEKARDGRVSVNAYLQLPGHPEVYVVGDCARFVPPDAQDGQPLPPNAPVAIQEGEYVADRIAGHLGVHSARLEASEPFHYVYKGEMVALGRNDALAHVGPLHLSGLPGFLMWRLYYFGRLMGFKNRASILVDWIATYLYHREVTRLPIEEAAAIVEGGEPRVVSAEA